MKLRRERGREGSGELGAIDTSRQAGVGEGSVSRGGEGGADSVELARSLHVPGEQGRALDFSFEEDLGISSI